MGTNEISQFTTEEKCYIFSLKKKIAKKLGRMFLTLSPEIDYSDPIINSPSQRIIQIQIYLSNLDKIQFFTLLNQNLDNFEGLKFMKTNLEQIGTLTISQMTDYTFSTVFQSEKPDGKSFCVFFS